MTAAAAGSSWNVICTPSWRVAIDPGSGVLLTGCAPGAGWKVIADWLVCARAGRLCLNFRRLIIAIFQRTAPIPCARLHASFHQSLGLPAFRSSICRSSPSTSAICPAWSLSLTPSFRHSGRQGIARRPGVFSTPRSRSSNREASRSVPRARHPSPVAALRSDRS